MKRELYLQPLSLDLAWNDPGGNLGRIEAGIRERLEASSRIPSESQLFLFPELTLTGFVTQNPPAFALRDPWIQRLSDIARRNNTALAAGFPEKNPRTPKKPFNSLALFAPDGRVVARYHKTHLFTVGKNPESKGYSAGSGGVACVYRGWRIGFAVCFDIRFPGLFHQYAKSKVDLLLVASCWIGGPHKSYQYRTINSAHAILSQAYVASVNRSGKDPFYEYDGSQYVFSPFGENLFDQGPVPLDPEELERCRQLIVRPSDRPVYPIKTAR